MTVFLNCPCSFDTGSINPLNVMVKTHYSLLIPLYAMDSSDRHILKISIAKYSSVEF